MVAMATVLSLSGDAKPPNVPLAKMAPATRGKLPAPAAAREKPRGISIPHVPKEEPIKYEIKQPKMI